MKHNGFAQKYYYYLGLCLLVFYVFFVDNAVGKTNNDNAIDAQENIQIIATTNVISIDTNFSGGDIFIAGVLENADATLREQGHYDVIVVMEGPKTTMVMREKKRRMGFWVNADSLVFNHVPQFYALASTKDMPNIAKPEIYRNLGLGIHYLSLPSDEVNEEKQAVYRQQLIALKVQHNLYSQSFGAVKFGSPALFTAKFHLPANVPVGQHKVIAYLFRQGHYIKQVEIALEIVKAHIAYEIYNAASSHSLLYGIVAVVVAIATGFLGRFFFRKD